MRPFFHFIRHTLEYEHEENPDYFSKLDGTSRMTDILKETISH